MRQQKRHKMLALLDFLDALGRYQWLNILVTYVCMPGGLTLVACLNHAAFSPTRMTRQAILRIFAGFVVLRAVEGILYTCSEGLASGFLLVGWTLVLWFGHRLHGYRGLIRLTQMMSLVLTSDVLALLLMNRYLPMDRAVPMWVGFTTVPTALVYGSLPTIIANGVVTLLFMFIRRKRWNHSALLFVFLVAVVCIFIVLAVLLPSNMEEAIVERTGFFNGNTIVKASIPLVGIGLLLILAHFVFLYMQSRKQLEENASLLLEQAKLREVTLRQRSYHHNVGNMLYGLEGLAADNTPQAFDAYHAAMAQQHKMADGNMLVSLQSIPSPAVKNVILKKLPAFQEASIPFYLFCDPISAWFAMKEWDLCAVLGIMLDNALEAAKEAAYPFVYMQSLLST